MVPQLLADTNFPSPCELQTPKLFCNPFLNFPRGQGIQYPDLCSLEHLPSLLEGDPDLQLPGAVPNTAPGPVEGPDAPRFLLP